MDNRIVIGMSGGVDSAVAAWLLKQQGCECIGVFMHNWDETDENGCCTADEDYADVRRVCDALDIPYYSVNFSEEYRRRVFDYFLEEHRKGRTPNPDVLCNREIKFNAFLDFADRIGAGVIATGHYARSDRRDGRVRLLKGADRGKDQTYFLHSLTNEQLSRAVFPVGGMQKSEVRALAEKVGLPVAHKKDSTGVCFIGERNFRKFLMEFIPSRPGPIKTLSGEVIGEHAGMEYYTLGQRKGLGIGGRNEAKPWFVVFKDPATNTLYAEQGEHPALYSQSLIAENLSWISGAPMSKKFDCCAKFRYRQPDQQVSVQITEDGLARVSFAREQRAITPGQYVVFYDGDVCLGGGVIREYRSSGLEKYGFQATSE